jgi:hypothetical protein
MKKILVFSLILLFISAASTAQTSQGNRFSNQGMQRGFSQGRLFRSEKTGLRKDIFRNQIMVRRARRDGIVTPLERRRLHRAKCDTHRDAFRSRHNRGRRII